MPQQVAPFLDWLARSHGFRHPMLRAQRLRRQPPGRGRSPALGRHIGSGAGSRSGVRLVWAVILGSRRRVAQLPSVAANPSVSVGWSVAAASAGQSRSSSEGGSPAFQRDSLICLQGDAACAPSPSGRPAALMGVQPSVRPTLHAADPSTRSSVPPAPAAPMLSRMSECIFCSIVAHQAASEIVWDDDLVLAFMDINPVTDGHCLVVPKSHFVGLDDVPPTTAARMMNVGQRLATAMKRSDLRCDGVNLFFADGEAAFQEIFHSHLHVFPRFPGDEFTISANWNDETRQRRIGTSAQALRASL